MKMIKKLLKKKKNFTEKDLLKVTKILNFEHSVIIDNMQDQMEKIKARHKRKY